MQLHTQRFPQLYLRPPSLTTTILYRKVIHPWHTHPPPTEKPSPFLQHPTHRVLREAMVRMRWVFAVSKAAIFFSWASILASLWCISRLIISCSWRNSCSIDTSLGRRVQCSEQSSLVYLSLPVGSPKPRGVKKMTLASAYPALQNIFSQANNSWERFNTHHFCAESNIKRQN